MKVCIKCHERFESDEWQCPKCRKSPELYNGFLSSAPDFRENINGYKSEYFTNLFKLEAEYFWFRSRGQLLIWTLQYYFPRAKSFLEIGCGTGFVLKDIHSKLPDLMLSGSDVLINALTYVKHRLPDVYLFQMDACNIPFDKEFDVIGAFDILEHILEDEAVLSQMFQATKIGGGIILTVPQHRFLWSAVDEYSFHKRRYSRKKIVKKIENAGFKIVHITSFATLLLPLMLFSRIKQRRMRENFDPLLEFKISNLLNNVFEKVMMIERILIKMGFSLPIGGSLLVVAKKGWR